MDSYDAMERFTSMLLQVLPVFYGKEEEDPYLHLQSYERKMLELFEDRLHDRLLVKYFPYSLRDDAFFWFIALPPASLASWSTFQECFICKHLQFILALLEQRQQEQSQQMQLQMQQFQAQSDEMNARWAAMLEEANQRIQEEVESYAREPMDHIHEPCIDDQQEEDDDGVLVTREGDTIHFQFRTKIVDEEEESEGEDTEPELPSTSDMFPHPLPESPEALQEPTVCMDIQGSSSSIISMSESHALNENLLDSVSSCMFGQESSNCVPIEESSIHLLTSSNFSAMDFIPSLELHSLDSKDTFSTKVEEGFVDLATSSFDRDSCHIPCLVEVSKEHDPDVSLELPTCNRPLPPLSLLHAYKDPYFPIMPKLFMISFQGDMLMARLRKLKVHILLRSIIRKFVEGDAGVASKKVKLLAEERKEELEQLPPPIKILDPPFEKGVFNPVV